MEPLPRGTFQLTETAMSNEALKQHILSFLNDYSIEVTSHDAGKLDAIAAELRPGTSVYVAHVPGVPLDDVVELAGRIQKLGLTAVPHVIARKLESREQLDRALGKLRELGVEEALVVAGDLAAENNAFDSSLEVLETGLFDEHGFRAVGVSGHPEGSSAIGAARVELALKGKAAFAERAGFAMRTVTQFGFDPDAVVAWEASTAAAGIHLPIHVGVAGPASLRQLVKFAALCGIGSSARMLMTRTGAMANLLRTQTPDEMITHLARHRASNPSSRLAKVHFFCFGGVAKTARWVNTVLSGRFVLNDQANGFRVEDVN
jgi:methylenetetrahydrofolate reductase (NADPH)